MIKTHTGVILEIGEAKQVTETFQKRRFVVDEVYNGNYGVIHCPLPLFLNQEKCSLIDQFKVGDNVVVSFDINSRPWMKDGVHQVDKNGDTSYFVEHRAWKIEPVVAESATPQDQADPAQEEAPKDFDPNPPSDGGKGPDDLPF